MCVCVVFLTFHLVYAPIVQPSIIFTVAECLFLLPFSLLPLARSNSFEQDHIKAFLWSLREREKNASTFCTKCKEAHTRRNFFSRVESNSKSFNSCFHCPRRSISAVKNNSTLSTLLSVLFDSKFTLLKTSYWLCLYS